MPHRARRHAFSLCTAGVVQLRVGTAFPVLQHMFSAYRRPACAFLRALAIERRWLREPDL